MRSSRVARRSLPNEVTRDDQRRLVVHVGSSGCQVVAAMKVVIAPDKFAGTMSAGQVAECIARVWTSCRPGDQVSAMAMADGGEGTVAALRTLDGARVRWLEVPDGLGRPVGAEWVIMSDGTAFVESAQVVGISRLGQGDRRPREATTAGLAALVLAAASASDRVVVGVGGTSTVDGGAGFARALGYRYRDHDGRDVAAAPADLVHVERLTDDDVVTIQADVVGAVDVDNPLLGQRGAARAFAAQKGASGSEIAFLETTLRRFADAVETRLPGGPWRDLPGAGAGGGLGFGLAAFAGATLASGAELVAEAIGLSDAVTTADLVITGEGQVDDQTLAGKAPGHVAAVAAAHGVPVALIAGRITLEPGRLGDYAAELGPGGLQRPIPELERATEQLITQLDIPVPQA